MATRSLVATPSPGSSFRMVTEGGKWTQLIAVACVVDTGAAAGPVSVTVTGSLGPQLYLVARLAADLPAGAFNGQVYFGLGAGSFTLALPENAAAPLPDVWLPPETVIVCQINGIDAVADVTFPSMVIATAEPLPGGEG